MLVKYWIHEEKDIMNMNAQLACLCDNGFIILSKEFNELNYVSSKSGNKIKECNVEITNICEDFDGEDYKGLAEYEGVKEYEELLNQLSIEDKEVK